MASPTLKPSLPPPTTVPTLVAPTNTPIVVVTNTPSPTPSGVESIYAGPGEVDQLVGLIGAGEVRPIVGWAAFTNWWVIQLDRSGRAGWINDESGFVHGYSGRVPIISAPELNGIVPTPGGNTWVPTPDANSNCSAPELFEGIVVDYAGENGIETLRSGKPDRPDELADSKRDEEGIQPLIQTVGEAVELDAASSGREALADPLLTDLADTAAPLELPGAASPQLPNLLPVAGIVLILAAVLIGLFAWKNRSNEGE